MPIDTRAERLALVIALALPSVTSLALMILAPGRVAPGTYVVVVALLLGSATIALNTWKAAQATGSIGQLIYETNEGIKADNNAARGRIAAMMVLSAATTAIIVATWLS